MLRRIRPFVCVLFSISFGPGLLLGAQGLSGQVTDPQGEPMAGAKVKLGTLETVSDLDGKFAFSDVSSGSYTLSASAQGFAEVSKTVSVPEGKTATVNLQFQQLAVQNQEVTVTADVKSADLMNPDPSQRVLVRDQILDANPGRPGAPVSIPGLPIETASGGIKAPQYFVPGVAGDHGEPIAQFFQVGTYLVPNNLSANAHGNGYSDPNVVVPAIIQSVQTDGGAFNVREGDHSVNLATIYGFWPQTPPYVTLTGDYRDIDLSAGWSPGDPQVHAWVVFEVAYGNGFLDRLEHRQQYKINGYRLWNLGHHQLSLFGIGYYGKSLIPGLVPIGVPGLHDTIDSRQKEQTHTGEIALNDIWHLTSSSELQLSGFFRTYNLSLYSNFGDGLIRQSEFRTVQGAEVNYLKRFTEAFSLMGGLDFLREAPRRLDLDNYLSTDQAIYGLFEKVTANNVTLTSLSPYIALSGKLASWLSYNAGWRRDQCSFDNEDLLHPENSFDHWIGFNSPKATVNLLPPERLFLPAVSFSVGETFFTNDPRIGIGTQQGTLVSRAHSYQLVVSKAIRGIFLRVTMGRVTQEESLAKIDPDTGLQEDEGPSRNRYISTSVSHFFRWGASIQASVAKADARDLSTGLPVPEAPRLIADVLGSISHLPWHLMARAEFEYVGAKPLGDGFVSIPVREFRGALLRPFGKMAIGINLLIASGYTGQTTEVLALPGDEAPFERVVGVRLPSYISVSWNYRFR